MKAVPLLAAPTGLGPLAERKKSTSNNGEHHFCKPTTLTLFKIYNLEFEHFFLN